MVTEISSLRMALSYNNTKETIRKDTLQSNVFYLSWQKKNINIDLNYLGLMGLSLSLNYLIYKLSE